MTTRLAIENWDPDRDLVLHGLDLWQSDVDASQASCSESYKKETNSFIERFTYTR
jgi:hypothetical protein